MSGRALECWTQNDPTNTEKLLTKEITSTSSPNHYLLADRALIRAHLKHVALAIEDAQEASLLLHCPMYIFTHTYLKSLRVHPSPIGYIAMAVAQLAQGDREEALRVFDLAFHVCEPCDNKLLLLLKSILVFESGYKEDAITRVDHLTKSLFGNYSYTENLEASLFVLITMDEMDVEGVDADTDYEEVHQQCTV
ncbi:hypothetical protein PISMIDRAFT_17106 [Pisolithus microcarpus 441]|uniref:Uncharacterized protein n=1 Tax=Pisolithus microcarpus 441 TaxID=765257 RepID=A0A0C9YLG6_9AGAM|nr:hypothetical protein PISMIDRAFT_17106 [Pisolithus microcarpus 441]